jgi:hypothetical protein
MKIRTFVSILILVLAVLIFAGSCATGKKSVKASEEPLYGTWVNPEYDDDYSHPAIIILTADGKWTEYKKQADSNLWRQGVYTIIEEWTDSDGNSWYKSKWKNTITGGSGYEILKVSDYGNTLEHVWGYSEDIELNKEHYSYSFFSRQ